MISFEEFQTLASTYNVIPLQRTLLADMLTPVSTYLTLRRDGVSSFLLESVEPNEKIGRFSFVGVEPKVLVRSRSDRVSVSRNGNVQEMDGTVFDVLKRLTSEFRQAPVADSTFSGGFVGYIGYDCVRYIERLALPSADSTGEDDAILGLFHEVVRFDHRNQLLSLTCNVMLSDAEPLKQQYEKAVQRLQVLELRLRNAVVSSAGFSSTEPAGTPADKERYCQAVTRAKEYIVEGDIFQVVLSRRKQLQYTGDPFVVYRGLRIINPSPYLFFLDFGETKLIGSSPEVLVRSINGTVEVFPIAGTRRRGKSEEEDIALEHELLLDEKELAEHLMLVDLGRNDIGRIAEFGTVHVPVFKRVERYSHVMHIVSEVRGTLKHGYGPVDVLKACFPAGTVSGAPKVRAMEIISELEGKRRGMYAGAVGYIGFNGAMDTCISIRTLLVHKNTICVQAGAGIVADSVPELEFTETENKTQALIEAIKLASRNLQL